MLNYGEKCMLCNCCNTNFSNKKEYNEHVIQNNCSEFTPNSFEDNDRNEIVYTNHGDPIRADDDISEFLNQDDDDYVPGSYD